VVGGLSIGAVGLLFLPAMEPGGLVEPIGFQIAVREWHALVLVAVLGVVTALVCIRLFAGGHWGGGLVLALDLIFLGFISGSDPKSGDHLFTYLLAASLTIGWLQWVARDLEDAIVEWLAYGSIAGVLVSFALMGVGERILLTCLLAGINLLYYGYFRGD
jgi:hypothetical protein